MARLGATPAGGVHRLALSAEDRRARDLFGARAAELGLSVTVDRIGNMFARREGTDPALRLVLLGSHLDSQPTGGRFDGPLGVLAGLEVLETLREAGIETRAPLEVANWTNEEGTRFAPAMLGSGAFSGRFALADALASTDPSGVTVEAALDEIGYAGQTPVGGRSFRAALELHIEQGPTLEEAECEVGVVTGVQGAHWYDLTLRGEETHAGPTPMERRVDPVEALGASLVRMYEVLAAEFAPEGRLTHGVLEARPASRNTVPGEVRISVDIRHPDGERLESMAARLTSEVAEICEPRGIEAVWAHIWRSPPVRFDDGCVSAVAAAARVCGYSYREMVSGAGHDSVHVADIAPTAMIFVPCEDGVSHNESERITPEQAEAGANVLLHAALALANAR
ncbi:MAG: M20 family metallo-hydrolase [Gemmatimonadetes bacterium]|nr:M20 family metallo-hydrolase [Gemmatimonadota bacterium]